MKRVVGLPGETVVVDSRGVTVDGVRLAEPYVLVNGGAGGTFSVPEGVYLVLGDNRTRSSDSRYWRQPFVARATIEGRVIRFSQDTLAGPARISWLRGSAPQASPPPAPDRSAARS